MTDKELFMLALDALNSMKETLAEHEEPTTFNEDEAITAIKERLAQEKSLQALHDENKRLGLYEDAYAQPEQEPVAKYCCRLCFNKSGSLLLDRMILCSECGNKRCPKATNHELQCTSSNELNQAGSIYNAPPQRTEQEPVGYVYSESGVKSAAIQIDLPNGTPLYITPPQNVIDKSAAVRIATALGWEPKREWVGLTAEEVLQCWEKAHEPGNKEHINAIRMADEVEAKLKEVNT